MSDYDRAVDRLRDEMAKTKNDAVRTVGEMMTMVLFQYPGHADAVLGEGKTLQGAYEAMYEYAKKNKKGNSCCVPPDKALEILCGYYGIEYGPHMFNAFGTPAATGTPHAEEQATKPQTPEDDFDLDAMLEGL